MEPDCRVRLQRSCRCRGAVLAAALLALMLTTGVATATAETRDDLTTSLAETDNIGFDRAITGGGQSDDVSGFGAGNSGSGNRGIANSGSGTIGFGFGGARKSGPLGKDSSRGSGPGLAGGDS